MIDVSDDCAARDSRLRDVGPDVQAVPVVADVRRIGARMSIGPLPA
jgi:hypothetical protein